MSSVCVKFFTKTIKLFGKDSISPSSCDTIEVERRIYLLDRIALPIFITETTHSVYEMQTVLLSEEEAIALAYEKLHAMCDETLEDAEILARYLPRLRTVNAEDCKDYEALLFLKQQRPGVKVKYRVELNGKNFASTSVQVTLNGITEEEIGRLRYLPALDAVTVTGGEPEQLNAIAAFIRICGNAGLESAGEEADLTDKWILKALKPGQIAEVMGACVTAINEGMASEIPQKEENGEPVDVTLEQMERKKGKDD